MRIIGNSRVPQEAMMKPSPSIEVKSPLLVGTVRSLGNTDNLDGDIVLTKVTVNGVERVKIFQREHQNGLLKLLFRAYDAVVGNVNCTKHLENIAVPRSQYSPQPLTHQTLATTLKNIRLRLEQSVTPQADQVDLASKLEGHQLLPMPLLGSKVELGEPQWSPEDMMAMLTAAAKHRGKDIDKEMLAWVADIRSDPKRVFTHHEKLRIHCLVDQMLDIWKQYAAENPQPPDDVKQIWLGHAKKYRLPPEGDLSKAMHRELVRLKTHADRRCPVKFEGFFRDRLTDLLRTKWPNQTPSKDHLSPLCTALATPDQRLQLAENSALCTALAYLHSQWGAFQDAQDVLFELQPLLLEARRAYALEMKDANNKASLRASGLEPYMLDRMIGDIRRSLLPPS